MNTDNSLIFRGMSGIVFFVVNIFSLYLLFRGHNFPGGGFIAGVCTSIALILLSFATGLEPIRKTLRYDPIKIAAGGLTLAFLSGLVPLFFGDPFLTTYNYKTSTAPLIGNFYMGSPLFFDVGVFLCVVGSIVKVVFVLADSTSGDNSAVVFAERAYAAPSEEPIEENPMSGTNVMPKEEN